MRVKLAVGALVLLGACAAPRVAVPEQARLDASQQAAYRAAVQAWIADDLAAARERVAPLLLLEPWYVPAHVLEQDASTALGVGEAARAWYRTETERRPDDAARALLDGRLTPREEGRREAAYRRARDLDPDSPWPSLALAFELDRAALAAFRRSISLADLGYSERSLAERERAAALHRESRELADALVGRFPTLAEAHAGAAEVLYSRGTSLGERETLLRALAEAEQAAELDPAHPGRHALVARVRRALIDDPGAEVALRLALELDPDDPGLLAGLGRVLLDLGRPDEARDVLRAALRARPDDAVVATDLGVAAQRVGDLDAAAERLRFAATLAPDDPRPSQALALVEIERGDRAAAKRALRAYLARGGEEREWAETTLAELDTDG